MHKEILITGDAGKRGTIVTWLDEDLSEARFFVASLLRMTTCAVVLIGNYF